MKAKSNKKSVLRGTCSDRLRAVGEETRLGVLRQLLSGPRTVGELNKDLRLEQSLLSHHLRLLREEGFVVTQKDGRTVRYSLSEEARSSSEGPTLNLGCCELSFGSEKNK